MDVVDISLRKDHPSNRPIVFPDERSPAGSNVKYLSPKANVFIVGCNRLHSELLLSYIKDRICINGTFVTSLCSIKPPNNSDASPPFFVLLDCADFEFQDIWKDLHAWKLDNMTNFYIAFCNVKPDLGIENIALRNDIHGIFYSNDPIEIIPKGMMAILDGDIWYNRKVLRKCLSDQRMSQPISDNGAAVLLTPREKEILNLISSGNSNKTIADKLCISLHTVKTHIYNIYKKTGVENRYQALLWSSKHL